MVSYMIIISMLLMTAVNVRAECERPFVGENKHLVDESGQQTFPDGVSVKFKCAPGYVTEDTTASKSITCMGNKWSELELRCKKKSCGSPGEITNGKYVYPSKDGILFGATITAKCNDGYHLVGLSSRNCREKGWDARAPVCEVVKCSKPPSIPNGVFEPEYNEYDFEEAVTYSCLGGLDLIGNSVIACSGDGTFQPPPPRCLSVSCDHLVIPHANRIGGKSPPYKYKNFVQYKCVTGYRMEGSDSLTCTEDGWDPPPPQCNVITCLKPPAIENGGFNPPEELYEYGQTVTYSCNKGFRLNGASKVSCTEDGTFQAPPQCLDIICDLPSISHGEISESSLPYKYGVSVQITCDEGYRIEGSEHLTCEENGWSSRLPQCIAVTCDTPNINNAVIVGEKALTYGYKMSIQYKCNKGYTMEGSDLLTCEQNGWNSPSPKCNIVTCLPPDPINNGHIKPVKKIYNYKDTVTFSCTKPGFRLQGASTISCTEFGTFQPSPQCVGVICDEPQITNGFIIETKSVYVYKSLVEVQCNTGYMKDGPGYLTCEEDGWNPPPHPCYLNNHIWLTLLILLVVVLVCCLGYWCYQKNKKSEESKDYSKSKHCSLVSMSTTPKTEELSLKSNY